MLTSPKLIDPLQMARGTAYTSSSSRPVPTRSVLTSADVLSIRTPLYDGWRRIPDVSRSRYSTSTTTSGDHPDGGSVGGRQRLGERRRRVDRRAEHGLEPGQLGLGEAGADRRRRTTGGRPRRGARAAGSRCRRRGGPRPAASRPTTNSSPRHPLDLGPGLRAHARAGRGCRAAWPRPLRGRGSSAAAQVSVPLPGKVGGVAHDGPESPSPSSSGRRSVQGRPMVERPPRWSRSKTK